MSRNFGGYRRNPLAKLIREDRQYGHKVERDRTKYKRPKSNNNLWDEEVEEALGAQSRLPDRHSEGE